MLHFCRIALTKTFFAAHPCTYPEGDFRKRSELALSLGGCGVGSYEWSRALDEAYSCLSAFRLPK